MATSREHRDMAPGQAERHRTEQSSKNTKQELTPKKKKILPRINLKHKIIIIKTKTTESQTQDHDKVLLWITPACHLSLKMS